MKLLISEIIDYILGISPMYNAPKFTEVLALNDDDSFTGPFKAILKKALSDYELKYPLLMWDKSIYIPDNEMVTFKDNYQAYLNGDIVEDNIELIPTSVVHYTDGLLRAYRDFTYVMPKLRIPRKGLFKISYFTKYPLILNLDKHEPKLKFTEDSHIYGISSQSGPDFTYLMYQIELYLLLYLRDQRAQMSYVDLPLELFNNLDTRIGEIQADITDWYQNPIWYAKLYI